MNTLINILLEIEKINCPIEFTYKQNGHLKYEIWEHAGHTANIIFSGVVRAENVKIHLQKILKWYLQQ